MSPTKEKDVNTLDLIKSQKTSFTQSNSVGMTSTRARDLAWNASSYGFNFGLPPAKSPDES